MIKMKEENVIILQAKGKLEDKELREWVSQLSVKIDTINERTKAHTRDIMELRRWIKQMKK